MGTGVRDVEAACSRAGISPVVVTALVTTVIGILVYMVIKRLKPSIKRGQPVYAVTG